MIRTKSTSRLWRLAKIIAVIMLSFFLLAGLALWIFMSNKNEWLLQQIQSTLESSQSGELTIQSLDFKLLKNFPDVTLSLDSVTYYEHRDSIRSPEEKPILQAANFYVALELLPLLREELQITEISIKDASLNLIEYKDGTLNLAKALAPPTKPKSKPKSVVKKTFPTPQSSKAPAKKKPAPSPAPGTQAKASTQIDLHFIGLTDVQLSFTSLKTSLAAQARIKDLEIENTQQEEKMTIQLRSAYDITSLAFNDFTLPPGALRLNADFTLDKTTQLVSLENGELEYDLFTAKLQGSYAHQQNQKLDLRLDASSNDLALLSTFLKAEVVKQNRESLQQGHFYMKGTIQGELKKQMPHLNFTFGVKELSLQLPSKIGEFKNVGFEGTFDSGVKGDFTDATLSVKEIRGQVPGGFLKGYMSLQNFTDPYLRYNLKAQLQLDRYDEIFNITSLRQLSGKLSLRADFDGPLKLFATHQMDSSRSSEINVKDVSFIFNKTKQSVQGLSGKVEHRNNQLTIDSLAFTYGENDLLLNGKFDNLLYFLLKGESEVLATGSLHARQLITQDFLFDTLLRADIQDKIQNLSLHFEVKASTEKRKNLPNKTYLTFTIPHLSAELEQLPNINSLKASGVFTLTDSVHLTLSSLQATMPQGTLEAVGTLTVPEKRLWTFDAKVKAIQFPWNYVRELVAEIKGGIEPSGKKLSVKEMDLLTAHLDVSASMLTYPFDLKATHIRNSKINLRFADGRVFSTDKLDLALTDLTFKHPENSGDIVGLVSTKGNASIRNLKIPGLNAFDVVMDVQGKHDSLEFDFSSRTQKARRESGQLFIDLSGKDLAYHLFYQAEDAKLDYFMDKYYKKRFMQGNIDYILDLSSTGTDFKKAKENLHGSIQIKGESLDMYGVDVDDILKRYERSQNFNLTDVGAVLIAGPVGLAVTKGSDFVSLATINLDSNHQTHIQELMANWKIEKQQLLTEDVAFSTGLNRIAFNGSINLANDSIPGLTIAVVDKNGCSLMDQKLYGKTNNLQTGKINITKTLLGSVINFVNAVVGKNCKPVYSGKVKAPQP